MKALKSSSETIIVNELYSPMYAQKYLLYIEYFKVINGSIGRNGVLILCTLLCDGYRTDCGDIFLIA